MFCLSIMLLNDEIHFELFLFLLGKDELQQARAEMILDHFTDLAGCFRVCYTETNEELKKEKFKKFADEQIPHCIGLLEKILEQNKTEYLAGNELTSK
jgi:hypothetical protein